MLSAVIIIIVSVCGNTMCYLNYREDESTLIVSWRRLEHANRLLMKIRAR